MLKFLILIQFFIFFFFFFFFFFFLCVCVCVCVCVCAHTQQNRNVKIIVELNFLVMNKIKHIYFIYENSLKTFISYMRKAYILMDEYKLL